MRASDRHGIAVTVAVLLASLTVAPLTSDASFLGLSWLLVLLLGGLSIALRRARWGVGGVLSVQLLLTAGFSLALSLATPEPDVPWFWHYPRMWAAGIEHMQTQASPMDPNDGVKLIFVTVIGLIAVLTDLLVSGIHRPSWAIAPPATLFLVPALGLGTDTGVVSFLCIAVGYLAILVAEGLNASARWTRGLTRDSAEGFGTAMPVVWRAAGYLAGPAIVATIILGVALPTLVLPGFGFGQGPGGNGPLQLTDPTLDLRRNLTEPQNRVVLQYQTDTPGGVYLRMASLPQLSAAGFTNVQIRLNTGSTLPVAPGLADPPATSRTTTIKVLDFGSQYLPLPYAPRSFSAPGDWRYDANSLVVVDGADRPDTLRNLTYTVQSADIAPDVAGLGKAAAGAPIDAAVTREVPKDLPAPLIDLARQVTAGADTPAAKASAIQTYLRSSRFTYSTDHLPGGGYQALENFLLRDHQGYCEQFAASMAVMARIAGIPSRVSVGFLPGVKNGNTYDVSINDMHAWPELYFAGYGWVRYEPTPAVHTGAAPAWTVPSTTGGGKDDPTTAPTAGASASAGNPKDDPSSAPNAAPVDPRQSRAFPWVRTLLGGGLGLLGLLVLAAPATVRIRRRTARLADQGPVADQVEAAWSEIRDTVVDYGGAWPDGSPRTIGNEIAHRLESEGSVSMSRVATLVERSRYAREFADPAAAAELAALTTTVRRGIAAPASWPRRLRAALLPTSLFRRRR